MKQYFEIRTKKRIKLKDTPVLLKSKHLLNHQFEQTYKAQLHKNQLHLEEFQECLYAEHRRAILIIFQGMDTAGKDGAIKHVMSGVNPQGCFVVNFKQPTANELDHDFLWKANTALPARGQIGIFNRSYYEEALIARVHPELLQEEKLPSSKKHDKSFWQRRYHDIQQYENYLARQGCEIIKIFIHISNQEQKRRLKDRFSDPKKLWKISRSDILERSYWSEYQLAYEECIKNTASKVCPWYIVPGDDKDNARLSISKILLKRFKKMKIKYPSLSSEEKIKLKKLRSLLMRDRHH